MLRDILTKKFIRAFAVLGMLSAVLLVGQAATAAPAYPPGAETTTELWLEKSTIAPGESNTAYVRVTSSAAPPQGTVTFRISGGGGSATVALVNGEASWQLPTDGLRPGKTYRVTAFYNGTEVALRPSQDVAYLTVASGDVAGVAGEQGADDVAAASAGDSTGGLPSVGQDSTTQIAAVAGAAMLAFGGFLLYRRRVRG